MKAVFLRPLAIFTVTFFLFLCNLFTADTGKRLWSAVIFSFLYIICLLVRYLIPTLRARTMERAAVSALAFFLAGTALASALSYFSLDIRMEKFAALYNSTEKLRGTVTDVVWDGGYGGIYTVKVKSAGDLFDFYCVLSGNGGIEENSIIECDATFSALRSDAQFDERRYYLSKNIVISAESENITVKGDAGVSLTSLARRLNGSLSDILLEYLGEEGGFAAALLLGNKEHLADTLNRDFTRLGISHVLAISGMHLTVLCAFIAAVLRPFGKRTTQFGCIFTVIFYMFITGLAPAVTRSGVMLLIYMTASFLGKGGDRFTNLGLSVFIICIFDPYSCADIGLQLSFAAVMAIFLFTEKKKELLPEKLDAKNTPNILLYLLNLAKGFADACILTIIIVLFMLPLEWMYFGSICIVSPLVSPIFSFITDILLWTLPLLLILSPIPAAARLLSIPIRHLIKLITYLANIFSRMRNITLPLNVPFGKALSLLIFLGIIAFCITKRKARLLSLVLTIMMTCALVLSAYSYTSRFNNCTYVSMLNYKKSCDGILLASDRKVMLIDIGNGYSGIINEGIASMRDIPAQEIEVFMMTHLHNASAQTLDSLLSNQTVRSVYIPKDGSDAFDTVVKIAKKYKIEVLIYELGEALTFEDVKIETFPHTYIDRSVQPSVRIDISAFGESFTYLGGAYTEAYPHADLKNADNIWFGTHGPLYKEEYSPLLADDCNVFATGSAKNFLTCEPSVRSPREILLGD